MKKAIILNSSDKTQHYVVAYGEGTPDEFSNITDAPIGSQFLDITDKLYYVKTANEGLATDWTQFSDEYPTPAGTINITENGENIDVKQYATANVAVPQPSGNINITQNGEGVDIAQYATATVNVPAPDLGFLLCVGINRDTYTTSAIEYGTGISAYPKIQAGDGAQLDFLLYFNNFSADDKVYLQYGDGEPSELTCTVEDKATSASTIKKVSASTTLTVPSGATRAYIGYSKNGGEYSRLFGIAIV